MRELKFRAWDNLKKEWLKKKVYHFNPHFNEEGIGEFRLPQHPAGFTIQQYTGLKDKNGKEIYEGDIVKHRKHNKEVRIGEFSDGVDERTGVFLQDPKIKHINFGTNRLSSFSSCEIIGNVFENPELLKTNE